MKISSFLIGMVVVGLFVTVFVTFLSGITSSYAPNLEDSVENNLSALNKIATVQENTDEIRDQIFQEQDATGVTDLLGKYLGAGYQVLKLSATSVNALYEMIEVAFSNSFLGNSLGAFKSAALVIATILIVFAIIAVLVGRQDI